jgi:hypothetical protein
VAAFLSIIRESPDSKDANLIKKILKPQVEEARRSREADEAFAEARRAVVRLLRAGHTLEGVVKSFTPRHIADALFEFGDPALIEQYRGELVELLVRDGLSIKQIAQRWFDSRVDEVYNLADNRGLRAACADHRRHLPGSD